MRKSRNFPKAMKYIGLTLAGLFLDVFCILAGAFSLWINIGIVSLPLTAVLIGFLHSCLCRIIRKDLGVTTIWYTVAAQLLPIAGAASVLIVTIYKRNTISGYDFKGLEQAFCTYSVITLVLMLAVSFLINRGMKKSQTKSIQEKSDER